MGSTREAKRLRYVRITVPGMGYCIIAQKQTFKTVCPRFPAYRNRAPNARKQLAAVPWRARWMKFTEQN